MMEAEKMKDGGAKTALPAAGNPGPSPASAELSLPGSPLSLQPSAVRLLFAYWLPLLAYCALIFYQSHHPAPEELPSIPGFDKILHLGAYGVLGVLFYRAYRSQWPRAAVQTLFWAAAGSAALYGLSDEIHQSFIPFRSADPLDWAADVFGGFIGTAAYLAWLSIAARRSPRAD